MNKFKNIKFIKFDINNRVTLWERYVDNIDSQHLSLALNPSFAQIFSNLFGMTSEYYLIKDEELIIGLIVGLKKLDKYYSLPVLSNGGIFLFKGINLDLNKLYHLFIFKLNSKFEIKSFNKFSKFNFSKKVTIYKELPENDELLMSSFKSKLRSQIKKGIKNELTVKINHSDSFNEFYTLYSKSLHRLGTPVNGKDYFKEFLNQYQNGFISFFTIYYKNQFIGASMCFSYRSFFEVMWAATDPKYNNLSTNMLLYYEMMSYAIQKKMKLFSFGRSDIGSNSLRFKKQWDVKVVPIFFNYKQKTNNIRKFKLLSKIWKFIPYRLSLIIGPLIRKKLIN